jgi:predicted TIM-barrel fold metal-dependent hydrolase
MIIDMHRHPVTREWFSDDFWKGFARMIVPALKASGVPANVETVIEKIFPKFYDIEGQRHLAQMEIAGIDATVMFLFDVGLFVGEPKVSIEDQNRVVFQMSQTYPEKIIPFATTDPRRTNAQELVKKCFEDYGAKGLKLHPGAGFNPETKEVLQLVESIASYSYPVVIHTGASVPPTSSRYCNPIYLDAMLLEFPDVPVIAAHMGHAYHDELFSLARYRPNLYTDISAWQMIARFRYDDFANTIRKAVDTMGADRILFGTDNPYFWRVVPESDYVGMVKNLSSEGPENRRLNDEDIGKILGGNAKRLLGL